MHEAKSTSTPLAMHDKLSDKQKPSSAKEMRDMEVIPYSNLVGSLMYTMVCTRPDIAHVISVCSRYMADPGKDHWEVLKKVLRYLKGSADKALLFERNVEYSGDPIVGFTDSDYAANEDNRRSQSGYIFTLFGSAVSWKSSLQHVVALSTTEAEYMAVTEAVKEALWLKGIVSDFGIEQKSHQTFHERSKHISVKLHFVRDIVEKGDVRMEKVSTDDNASDILTKAVPVAKFEYCLELVKLISKP
ncbi:secreted RxLR effector protein 161-like [Salvia miltiorrhiza]|uniref:secreted RxLR effector protein 161-like n=1 Tax=Salvia miltiorrhiza TaxID=226208 RepID=UPI0025ACFEB8|nr:secreted RxLR effector protein 161-like [Salvia miltiorrhiza]